MSGGRPTPTQLLLCAGTTCAPEPTSLVCAASVHYNIARCWQPSTKQARPALARTRTVVSKRALATRVGCGGAARSASSQRFDIATLPLPDSLGHARGVGQTLLPPPTNVSGGALATSSIEPNVSKRRVGLSRSRRRRRRQLQHAPPPRRHRTAPTRPHRAPTGWGIPVITTGEFS
jgi:hypothetical protein